MMIASGNIWVFWKVKAHQADMLSTKQARLEQPGPPFPCRKDTTTPCCTWVYVSLSAIAERAKLKNGMISNAGSRRPVSSDPPLVGNASLQGHAAWACVQSVCSLQATGPELKVEAHGSKLEVSNSVLPPSLPPFLPSSPPLYTQVSDQFSNSTTSLTPCRIMHAERYHKSISNETNQCQCHMVRSAVIWLWVSMQF